MAAHKYKFNPHTLLYEKVRYTFKQRFKRGLPFYASVILFSLLIMFFSHEYFESPKLKLLNEQQTEIDLQLQLLKGEISMMDELLHDIVYNDDHIYRTYFEVDPLPSTQREAGFGGHEKEIFFSPGKYRNKILDINRSLDILAKKTVVQSHSYDYVIELAKTKEKRLAARPAIQPVSIKELTRFGSAFGMRFHPILKQVRMHEGIDLTCPKGTKVFATADGIILESGYSPGGLGIRVFIDHGYGYRTIYGHLDKVTLKKGDKVKRGDVIGFVGNTGLSLAPHLHYEICVNGRKVNPVNYYANDLSAEEYDKMIDLLSNADPGFDIN
jgi:murein DD-endopeptidase MepM/ murein hydrolase activator NlpD